MRKLLLLATLLVVFTSFAMSVPLVVTMNEDVHFDYPGMKANDFHIEGIVKSGNDYEPRITNIVIFGSGGIWKCVHYEFTRIDFWGDEWQFKMDFVLEPGMFITECADLHFGVDFLVDGHNIVFDLVGWWTWDGGPPIPIDGGAALGTLQEYPGGEYLQAAVTGFEVEGDMLRVFNNTELSIELRDYEVAISNEPIPLEDMFVTGLGRPGEPSPEYPWLVWEDALMEPTVLGPGQQFEVALSSLGIFLQPGQFLVMRGDAPTLGTKDPIVLITGKDNVKTTQATQDWQWIWHQHGQ